MRRKQFEINTKGKKRHVNKKGFIEYMARGCVTATVSEFRREINRLFWMKRFLHPRHSQARP